MNYRVLHHTTYRYEEPVPVSLNQCCLRPRDFTYQRCISYELQISPEPQVIDERTDLFGNIHSVFTISAPHREMRVSASSRVEILPRVYPQLDATPPWETARDFLASPYPPAAALEAAPYIFPSAMIRTGPQFADYAKPSFAPGRPLLSALLDLTVRIKKEFTYDTSATTLATKSEEVLAKRRGVCQDFAQLQAACLRSLGLATRYVSGYLLTRPPPGKVRLIGADASHCWVSVFSPELGWIALDPTNGTLVNDEHITIAWGRDYTDVTPVKGMILGGGAQKIQVGVDVEPSDIV